MFPPDISKAQLVEHIQEMSELDFARFRYCQEMMGTYLAIGKFEDHLINAMLMCDRVKLKKVLGTDTDRWAQMVTKKSLLQKSTLGSLIKILTAHSIALADLHYLQWIKDKRDYFVHRLFHDGAWPGELDSESCSLMTRRLVAVQIWMSRAERNIWLIFERAGFVELDLYSDGSILAMNVGIYDFLGLPDSESDQ